MAFSFLVKIVTIMSIFNVCVSYSSYLNDMKYYKSYVNHEDSPADACSTVDYGNKVAGRNGLTDTNRLWTQMYVWFEHELLNEKTTILFTEVLQTIQSLLPCLKIRSNLNRQDEDFPGFPQDFSFVHVTPRKYRRGKSICALADVGKKQGVSKIDIDPKCTDRFDLVLHQFLHVLGLNHEHNSPERDHYITVNFENIEEQQLPMFVKVSRPDYATFSQPYNPNSIMHYSNAGKYGKSYTLTKAGEVHKELYNIPWGVKNHPESRLQFTDVLKLRFMYSFHNCPYGGEESDEMTIEPEPDVMMMEPEPEVIMMEPEPDKPDFYENGY